MTYYVRMWTLPNSRPLLAFDIFSGNLSDLRIEIVLELTSFFVHPKEVHIDLELH